MLMLLILSFGTIVWVVVKLLLVLALVILVVYYMCWGYA